MSLPFALVDGVPVLVGYDEASGPYGLSVPDGDVAPFDLGEVVGVVSVDPAAVYYGVDLSWAGEQEQRTAAAPRRRGPPHFAARGQLFKPLPHGMVSGYTAARETIERHRRAAVEGRLHEDVVRLSSLFAISTIQELIQKAEPAFECFMDLFDASRLAMKLFPSVVEIRECFNNYRNQKAEWLASVEKYAPTILGAMKSGLQDRALRRHLCTQTVMPLGMGIAKLSFTLLLLGQDCMCMDSRIMHRMFGVKEGDKRIEDWKKVGPHVSPEKVDLYEAVEDAFLERNRFYEPLDPIGRAKAQWTSWEGLGRRPAPAEHRVWLDVVTRPEIAASEASAPAVRREPSVLQPEQVYPAGEPAVHADAEEDRRSGARRGWEHRRERDEMVEQNLPPELVPLWRQVRGQFRGTPGRRYDAFMEYAESHRQDVDAAMLADVDRQVDALIAQRQQELESERAR